MLIKVKMPAGSVLYFDATRVLYVVECGDMGPQPDGTVARVYLDADATPAPVLQFTAETWPGVRILLGIDTAVMVEAAQ